MVVAFLNNQILILRHMVLCEAAEEVVVVVSVLVDEVSVPVAVEEVAVRIALDVHCTLRSDHVRKHVLGDLLPTLHPLAEEVALRQGSHCLEADRHSDVHSAFAVAPHLV